MDRTALVGTAAAALLPVLIAVSCTRGRVTDSLLDCSDWTPASAAPAGGPSVVAENAAWARPDAAGRYLVYRSAGRVLAKQMATGSERTIGLADNVSVFLGAVDGDRFVAFYSDAAQGSQEYVLADIERCEWRVLGITVSTVDPVIGFSAVSAMSLDGERLFYAIDRGTLRPAQEFLLDLTNSTRRVAAVSPSAVTEARLGQDRAVWLQKDAGGTPGVVAWSYLDGGLLSVDLPSKASPTGLVISGSRAVWTDSRDVFTSPPDTNLYMLDLVDGSVTQLTTDRRTQEQPSILGHLVAWSDDRSGNFDIRVRDLDTNEERVVAGTAENERFPVLTASGIFWQVPENRGSTVWFDPTVRP